VVDVFDEVDEQIRQDRFHALVRRLVPYFIGALILSVAVVVGLWAYDKVNTTASAGASEAYAKGLAALQKGDLKVADGAFADAAKGPAGYKALALMQRAGIAGQQNNQTQAVALLDQAAGVASDPMIGDAARLEAAYATMDTSSFDDLNKRLQPLLPADRPYHVQAREALALAKIAAGKTKDARSDLAVIQLMTETPDSVRQRVGAIMAVIDSGSAASLKAMVKESLATPAIAPPLGLQGAPAADGQAGN
jgi:hypothetical protein